MRRGNPWMCKRMMDEGLRITQTRRAILGIFMKNPEQHLSAEEIFFMAHRINPSLGFATVYRTLDLLTRMGLIQKLDFGGGQARYEMIQPSGKDSYHHHLVCTSCGKVVDYAGFTEEEKNLLTKIEKELSEKHKFQIKNHIIQFSGICSECGKRR
ncbi:MAG: Fur family transcriptional regulator [Candidatus Ratteibacteria bacterium]|jgi:Fur family ferric uptake transcriptional regulator